MKAGELIINGREIDLGGIWVQLKSKDVQGAVSFSLLVRGEFVVDVFDKGKSKPRAKQWVDYIMEELREFGTFALDHYLGALKRIDGIKHREANWVIISVKNIRAVTEGILLEGLAEEFRRERVPELKPLR